MIDESVCGMWKRFSYLVDRPRSCLTSGGWLCRANGFGGSASTTHHLTDPQVPSARLCRVTAIFLFSINRFWHLFIPFISSWIVQIYCVSFSQSVSQSVSEWGWKHASWPFSVDPTPCCSYTRSAQTTSGLPPHCRTQPPRPSQTEPRGQPAERQRGRLLSMKTDYKLPRGSVLLTSPHFLFNCQSQRRVKALWKRSLGSKIISIAQEERGRD